MGKSEAEHHKGKLPPIKAQAKVCTAEGFWSVFGLGIRVSHAVTLHRSTCTQAVHAFSHPRSPCRCTVQIPGSPCCITSTGSEAGDPPGWPQVHPPGKASFQRTVSPARCLYLGGAALADLEGKRGAVSGRRKGNTEQKSRARTSPPSPSLEEEKPWKHSAVKSHRRNLRMQ